MRSKARDMEAAQHFFRHAKVVAEQAPEQEVAHRSQKLPPLSLAHPIHNLENLRAEF